MHLPYLRSRKQKTEKQIISFRGINYGEGVQDGQLEDSRNVTSERFPCLSPRDGRSTEGGYENVTAVYYKNGQFVVNGTDLLRDGVKIGTVTEGKKQFASVNTKVIIFPDKVMYDLETGKLQSLAASYTTQANMLEVVSDKELAIHLGNYSAVVKSSGTRVSSDKRGFYPTFKAFDKRVLSVEVNPDTGEITWGEERTAYAQDLKVGHLVIDAEIGADGVNTWAQITKINKNTVETAESGKVTYRTFDYDLYGVEGTDFSDFQGLEALGFKVGDTVELSGFTTFPDYNKAYNIRGFGEYTTADENVLPTIIFDRDLFPEVGAEAGAVTISRKVPSLQVVCESNNRLWGAEDNTIYASALGDPTNIFTYDGLDTGSYAVPVASEGAFTGCCGFGNSVLFWKEDKLHKILGAYPSQYTMYEYNVPGVKLGSEQSLVNINEVLYYHGRDGVYRYSGGAPDLASDVFGMRRFEEASAGTAEGRYYISMKDRKSGAWGMWVYDTLKGLWVQEDDTQAMNFAADEGKLYCIGGSKLMCLNPDDSGEVFEWSATTTRMDEVFHNRKCYSKLLLRAELLEDSAWLQVDISCDGEPFKRVYTSRDKAAKTLAIPIMPKRCDSFRIRLSGEGKFIIRSLVREFGIGSEY